MKVRTEDGWYAEHRVVAGLVPGDGRIGHHVDGDKSNNARENIEEFESNSEHARYHMMLRKQEAI